MSPLRTNTTESALIAGQSQPSRSRVAAVTDGTSDDQLFRLLAELRSMFHKHGGHGSSNDALDDVCKLITAHLMAAVRNDYGISSHILGETTASESPAKALKRYVLSALMNTVPPKTAGEFDPNDFALRLRDSDDALAVRVIRTFDDAPAILFTSHARSDLLNETFGRFLAGSYVDQKELGQYLTPPEIVNYMVDLYLSEVPEAQALLGEPREFFDRIGPILDPSCGTSSFLVAMARRVARHGSSPYQELTTIASQMLVGVDKSDRMLRLSLANFAIAGLPQASLHRANAIAGASPRALHALDRRVGVILTNPPYGADFTPDEVPESQLAQRFGAATRSLPSEVLFMERYVRWLRPGGHALVVVPDSILTNSGLFGSLRAFLGSRTHLDSVTSLPVETFAGAGTMTKTSVIHLHRLSKGDHDRHETRFAVCSDVGYSISVRGAIRRKLETHTGQLNELLQGFRQSRSPLIQVVGHVERAKRWDATYHHAASDPKGADGHSLWPDMLRVSEVASLVRDTANPRLRPQGEFLYIEISDVDGARGVASAKRVMGSAAPSRARRLVAPGDVLVSTVRPERRTIGVVPPGLAGAICTTGFGVLRPVGIDPMVLARLLRSEFVTQQLVRHRSGIAYPAVGENLLLDLVLPISRSGTQELNQLGERLLAAEVAAVGLRSSLDSEVDELVRSLEQK